MSDINTLMESLSKFNGKWPYQDAAEQLIKQQAEITTLREQVEKLTKERDALKTVPMKYRRMQFNAELQEEVTQLQKQLTVLAEQNAKMREALIAISIAWSSNEIYSQHFFNEALSLPNLTTPVLNRIKAKAYREAAKFCINNPLSDAHCLTEMLRAKADELENLK